MAGLAAVAALTLAAECQFGVISGRHPLRRRPDPCRRFCSSSGSGVEEPHPYARLVARSLSQRGTKAGVHDEGVFVVVVGVVADKECGGNRLDWRRQMAFHDPHTSKAISGGSGVGGGSGGGVTLK